MHFYRYWTRVVVDDQGEETDERWGIVAFGCSDISESDAHRVGLERARRIAEWVAADGERDDTPFTTDYYERPIREAIVDEVQVDDQPHAVITRNGYGAYVLNAAAVLFADIDAPPTPLVKATFWQRLLGSGDQVHAADTRTDQQKTDELLAAVGPVMARQRLSCRVYQTAAGFRAAITSQLFDPRSDESTRLLEDLRSDTQYNRLCLAQACYRARVSPKPWRINGDRPPSRFPFTDPDALAAYEAWDRRYQQASTGFSACRVVAHLGQAPPHPVAERVLALHDELACTGRPLA